MGTSRKERWPTREEPDNRLEPLCLPELNPRFTFDQQISIFTIGSCFARNIEEYLQRIGMHLPTMSFSAPPSEMPVTERATGLLNKYTPPAILSELRFALDPSYELELDDHFIDAGDGSVLDLHLPSYATVSLERARERRLEFKALFEKAADCELVIITLGLIECWKDLKHDVFISQIPPPRIYTKNRDRFVFHRLDFATSFQIVDQAVRLILATRPPKKILMTTSPVPLGRTFTNADVITANMYSKSVLRVVAEEIMMKYPDVDYFPSYETVTLTDRDLAWNNDLRHVRDGVVGRIVERVSNAYFPSMRESGPRLVYAEARMLLTAGQVEQALTQLESVRSDLAGDKQFLGDLGNAYMRAGRWEAAITAFESAIELDPGAPRLHLLLGRAYWRSGRAAEARGAGQRALDLDDKDAKARAFLERVDLHLAKEARHPVLSKLWTRTRPRLRSS